jgi:dTDP-glucose 4,6-dehydratase
MKRILVTGLGGSIGIHLFAHIMHNTDWYVVGIDSFRHKGYTDRVAYMLSENPEWAQRLTVITHDMCAPFSEMMKKKIGHIDYIINMASLSDVYASIQEPVPFIQNNVSLVLNMLEYAREVKPDAFIQISTDETSGPSEEGQQFEEWSPTLPSNPYSASKASQEAIAIAYWRTYNVPVVITNTVNNFGEMQSPAKFPVIIQKKVAADEIVQIHGSEGDVGSRFYLHSRNFSDALVFILKNLPPHIHEAGTVDRPDRYNITGEERIDNLQFAKIIAKSMGKELKYEFVDSATTRPGHDKHYGLSGEKLKKLGWTPPLSFEESLKNVIEWQTKNNNWIS